MAASLEIINYMSSFCLSKKPKNILDLGSGISTVMFSLISKNINSSKIQTYDDDESWLKKTEEFVKSKNLPTHKMGLWSEFKNSNKETFDFIFYDLGRIPVRLENMSYAFSLLNKGGTIIVDDIHKPSVKEKCMAIIKEQGFKKQEPTEKDKFGRYSYIVSKN
jgi:predicted O-methyltransferase YrrM